MDEESARIVLTTAGPVKLALAKVQADETGNGHRLVLDAEMIDKEAFAELVKTQSWSDRTEAAQTTSAIPAPEKLLPAISSLPSTPAMAASIPARSASIPRPRKSR